MINEDMVDKTNYWYIGWILDGKITYFLMLDILNNPVQLSHVLVTAATRLSNTMLRTLSTATKTIAAWWEIHSAETGDPQTVMIVMWKDTTGQLGLWQGKSSLGKSTGTSTRNRIQARNVRSKMVLWPWLVSETGTLYQSPKKRC